MRTIIIKDLPPTGAEALIRAKLGILADAARIVIAEGDPAGRPNSAVATVEFPTRQQAAEALQRFPAGKASIVPPGMLQ
jgi:hypothetical protein